MRFHRFGSHPRRTYPRRQHPRRGDRLLSEHQQATQLRGSWLPSKRCCPRSFTAVASSAGSREPVRSRLRACASAITTASVNSQSSKRRGNTISCERRFRSPSILAPINRIPSGGISPRRPASPAAWQSCAMNVPRTVRTGSSRSETSHRSSFASASSSACSAGNRSSSSRYVAKPPPC